MANDHTELEKYVLSEVHKQSYHEKDKPNFSNEINVLDGLLARLLRCSSGREISHKTRARFLRMKAHKATKSLTPD